MIKDGENLNVYQLRLNKVALAVKSIPIGLSTKMPDNFSSSFYYFIEKKEIRLRNYLFPGKLHIYGKARLFANMFNNLPLSSLPS